MSDEATEVLRQLRAEQARRQREALIQVETSYADLQRAKKAYEKAVLSAHTYGAPNTLIARRAGVTETSIRMYIKRREGQQ